ncbi:MAG TPA: hypothetical protein VFV67_13585 [Actinophytocola sp.]|uniref:hypothetical protein n=1 Tax=Actinophytocola sp. TaxID=1872138 RepID=UPI002DB67A58|nr:hypothetical protein [Actinophytocola sp.]HEU5471678.1 hypothetical protein [Actinophytocola sp.]
MADDDRERQARADFLTRADSIDSSVRNLLRELDLSREDPEHERMLDAIMGACRAADALRAFAREDLDAATEATTAMSYYARRALGEAA